MDAQPIILIKKKGHHGGHHGGAWKVAYADFVTAMMALFIVLWLLSSTSKQTQEQIAGYFNDPKGTSTKKGSEGNPTSKAQSQSKHAPDLDVLKKQLLRAIQDMDLLSRLRKQIEITLTDEGLRVDLIEDKNGTFFESGSAKPTPALQQILKVISKELKEAPNRIFIEGHTDAQPYSAHAGYDNWDLSSDRANEARREMRADGIHASQVYEVRGFADQHLRFPDRPNDPANRRISIVVQPLTLDQGTAGKRSTSSTTAQQPEQGDRRPQVTDHANAKPTAAKGAQQAESADVKLLEQSSKKENAAAPSLRTDPSSRNALQRVKALFKR